jgi:hypothetical protein
MVNPHTDNQESFLFVSNRLSQSVYKVRALLYREVFNSLDEFTALRFTAAGVSPAARRTRILLMNQPITFGMKGSN